jgi:pectate lyase
VTTTADSGPGSLRAAAQSSGAKWIRFDPNVFPVDGNARIRLQSPVRPTANTTIDGRGARVIIQKHGFFVDNSNVIATNLIFDFAAEYTHFEGNSAFTVGWPSFGVERIWIHKNTFLGAGPGQLDGAVDLLRGANRITVSWNKFVRWDKTMLLATDLTQPEAADLISIHHNHFDRNGQRQPLARHGRFHVWNNWFDRWDWNGSYGEAIVSATGARVLSERNIFDHTKPYQAIIAQNEAGAGMGYAKDVGSWFAPGVTANTSGAAQVTFNPGADHSYTPDRVDTDSARQTLRNRLASGTGWQR